LLLFPLSSFAYERIISLKPNLTEILFALGVGDKIVGVTSYCDYLAEARKIDKVADYIQPDLRRSFPKTRSHRDLQRKQFPKRDLFLDEKRL
jgi:hypothetical protein